MTIGIDGKYRLELPLAVYKRRRLQLEELINLNNQYPLAVDDAGRLAVLKAITDLQNEIISSFLLEG